MQPSKYNLGKVVMSANGAHTGKAYPGFHLYMTPRSIVTPLESS